MTYQEKARIALDRMYARFWTEEDGGHLLAVHRGHLVEKPIMIWEHTMLLLAMELYYDATGDPETKRRILSTWEYTKKFFTREYLVGHFGGPPNTAIDDAAWDVMAYWLVYRLTGDREALELTKETILNCYEHWKDGTLENGCWYNDWEQYRDHWKSTYIVGLLITAIEYCRETKDTPAYSQELLEQTLTLYRWVERDFRRDRCYTVENGKKDGSPYQVTVQDHLYWIDYNKDRENRDERNGPSGGLRPNDIRELGSVSAIFANMGMAALNQKLYEMFGWEDCRIKAVQTATALENIYNHNGCYLNDRDPHTNATMLRYYIYTLLATDATSDAQRDMLFRTADNLFATGELSGGWYYPWWSQVLTPEMAQEKLKTKQVDIENFMINATGVTMICGAALLEKLGFSPAY